MLRDLTIKVVKFWSCRDLCTGLRETLKAVETPAQALQGTWCRIIKVSLYRYICRYRDNGDGFSDSQYIVERPRGR